MNCPKCGGTNIGVKVSRKRKRINGWVRFRRCNSCGHVFKTIERYSYDTLQKIDKERLTSRQEQKLENVRRIKELAKKMEIRLAEE